MPEADLPRGEPAEQGPPITVVTAGNWFVSSDRIGSLVFCELEGRLPGQAELVDTGTAGLELLDFLRGQDLFILVDACTGKGASGAAWVVEPDLTLRPTHSPTLHQVGPLEALGIAALLYPARLPRTLKLVLVDTENLDEAGEVEAAHRAARLVHTEIDTWIHGTEMTVHKQ
jgi:hydrogenase maturation protease